MLKIKVQNESLHFEKSFMKKEVTVGRNDWNDVMIEDEIISKEHCKITIIEKENAVVVTDLKSRNGISYEGELLHEIYLKNGESFSIGSILVTVSMTENKDETKDIDISMLIDNRKKWDTKNLVYLVVITFLICLDYYFNSSDPKLKKLLSDIFESYVFIIGLWGFASIASCFFVAIREGTLKVFKRKWKYNLQFQRIFQLLIFFYLIGFLDKALSSLSIYFTPFIQLLTLFTLVHYFVKFYLLFFPHKTKKYYWKNFALLSLPILTVAGLVFYNVVIVDREGRLFERYNTELSFFMPYLSPTGSISDLENLLDKVDTLSRQELTSSAE